VSQSPMGAVPSTEGWAIHLSLLKKLTKSNTEHGGSRRRGPPRGDGVVSTSSTDGGAVVSTGSTDGGAVVSTGSTDGGAVVSTGSTDGPGG
jgi:hypothetical protein